MIWLAKAAMHEKNSWGMHGCSKSLQGVGVGGMHGCSKSLQGVGGMHGCSKSTLPPYDAFVSWGI